jgi:hypothetical protein
MLDFAQRYVQAIPWESFQEARQVMEWTNTFLRSDEAEERGLRLRLPMPAQLQAAEEAGNALHAGSIRP